MATITIDRKGSIPRVRVEVGHAHLGTYTLALFDQNSLFDSLVSPENSSTGDPIDDEFDLVSPKDNESVEQALQRIIGFTLVFEILVKALVVGPGEQYSVTVTVKQGHTVLGELRTGSKALTTKTVLEEGEWLIA